MTSSSMVAGRTEKRCPMCGESKPFSEYHASKSRANGIQPYCIDCAAMRTAERRKAKRSEYTATVRRYNQKYFEIHGVTYRAVQRLRKFGLTWDAYKLMSESQSGLCAVCAKPEKTSTDQTKGGRINLLAVDHCHVSGKVRALVCNACNRGMGLFGDDPDQLEAAAAYLRSHR